MVEIRDFVLRLLGANEGKKRGYKYPEEAGRACHGRASVVERKEVFERAAPPAR